jgi:hypothetical protein
MRRLLFIGGLVLAALLLAALGASISLVRAVRSRFATASSPVLEGSIAR